MKDKIIKYKQIILYIVFGVLTTAVNFMVYLLLNRQFGIGELTANAVAWIMAVIFAYITNKIYVFEHKDFTFYILIREFLEFMVARASSGMLDMFLLWMGVYQFGMGDVLVKMITSIIVVIMNYVLSKFWIFR